MERHRIHALGWSVLLAAAFVAGIFLRLRDTFGQCLGGDEIHAIDVASTHTFREALTYCQSADSSVPLTIYAIALMKTIGLSELTFRLPEIASGALLLLTPLLFVRVLGRSSTLAAMLLLATSPHLVYYSFTARPYGLAALFSVSALFGWGRFSHSPSAKASIGVGIASALAIFFHLFSGFVVAAILVASLRQWRRGALAGRDFLALASSVGGFTLLLLGPEIIDLLQVGPAKVGQTMLDPSVLRETVQLLSGFHPAYAVAVGVLSVFGSIRWLRSDTDLGFALVASVVFQALGLFLLRPLGGALAWSRYFVPALPAVLLLAALGLRPIESLLARLGKKEAGTVPWGACVATFALACLLALRGPVVGEPAVFEGATSSFRSNGSSLLPVHAAPDRVPSCYGVLVSRSLPGDVVLEFPGVVPWRLWRAYAGYQKYHHRPVKMACLDGTSYRRKGVRFDRLVDLSVEGEARRSGAHYLVVHRDLASELEALSRPDGASARKQGETAQALLGRMRVSPSDLQRIRDLFGEPLARDGSIELYAVTPD